MQKNAEVLEYSFRIYPRKMWVSDGIEGLDELFTFLSLTDNVTEAKDAYDNLIKDKENDNCIVCVIPVLRKDDLKYGALVVIMNKKDVTTGVVAHESVHVADYICEQLGIYSQCFRDGNEAYAYLVGYIADCISDSIKEFKKKKV